MSDEKTPKGIDKFVIITVKGSPKPPEPKKSEPPQADFPKNKAMPDLPLPDKIPVLIPPKALDAIKADGSYEFVEAVQEFVGLSPFR